jgi:hypothetical protein
MVKLEILFLENLDCFTSAIFYIMKPFAYQQSQRKNGLEAQASHCPTSKATTTHFSSLFVHKFHNFTELQVI